MFQQLKGWVLHFSESPYSRWALFFVAFIEASVFPVPPDILLMALILICPKQWWTDALICLAGSVLGGMLGYLIGWQMWVLVDDFFFAYVFHQDVFERVRDLFREYNFWAIFTAGFTPIPYKIFTIAAGVCTVDFSVFLLASITSRGARFFIVALLLRLFGPTVKVWIQKYFGLFTILFVLLLIGGFVLLKVVLKH